MTNVLTCMSCSNVALWCEAHTSAVERASGLCHYDFDNNESYQMDMLADEYKMVLRKAHNNISVFKGQVELVFKTKKNQKGAETNTQSVRATKPVPKRQLVFVPVTPTVQVKKSSAGEGPI